MRTVFLMIVMAGLALAQETSLTEVEILKGRVIGLEQGQLINNRAAIIKEIQPQLDQIKALDAKIASYNKQAEELGAAILKERKLDPVQFVVNWKDSKIEPKVQAKAEPTK